MFHPLKTTILIQTKNILVSKDIHGLLSLITV